MHRRASSSYGARMAPVGQAAMHRAQVPQWFRAGGSGSSSKSVRISPRKSQEPSPCTITFVFFPIQPTPARSAQERSSTGPVSTYASQRASGHTEAIALARSRRRRRIRL